MRRSLLTAKYCKVNAKYYKRIIPNDIELESYYDSAIPFKLGVVSSQTSKELLVPTMNSQGTKYTIHTFRILDFEIGDKIEFNGEIYFIQDYNKSYFYSTQYQQVEQYFATLK